jgi:pyrroloquinoline quinone biosynthesis protein A
MGIFMQSKRILTKEIIMWTTPAATEMRFGFEVTMYVMNK